MEIFLWVLMLLTWGLIGLLCLSGLCELFGIGRLPPGQVSVTPPPPAPPRPR